MPRARLVAGRPLEARCLDLWRRSRRRKHDDALSIGVRTIRELSRRRTRGDSIRPSARVRVASRKVASTNFVRGCIVGVLTPLLSRPPPPRTPNPIRWRSSHNSSSPSAPPPAARRCRPRARSVRSRPRTPRRMPTTRGPWPLPRCVQRGSGDRRVLVRADRRPVRRRRTARALRPNLEAHAAPGLRRRDRARERVAGDRERDPSVDAGGRAADRERPLGQALRDSREDQLSGRHGERDRPATVGARRGGEARGLVRLAARRRQQPSA